ncbi:NAD(P)/FAD-dependent oxidoreductase [Sediminicola luteus]|uniref:Pyridine nucleotide-disulfide oxidoreductase n=1 Tax=Sediminicola luteus TaxID=319238 RepID=A0A2A4GEK2_9FLAO|nr:FAD/NAD(P)-binding oxidoreductase [Sediminicola luteus]PCE66225.1 pyridine nucleotide-disulfide oxidoreductase [Sediminicola luteus]
MEGHHQIVVIGGGTAGIMIAAQLLKKDPKLDIAVLEPSETHYYQPAWTLVGAGDYQFGKTARPTASVMPKGVTWIKDYAEGFDPVNNAISTRNGGKLQYDYLVVAPGLVMAPHLIEGLTEALERKENVCSNYTDPEHTWKVLQNFKGGNAIFTQPATPIKCGGAPQKIAYLASHYFKKHGLADKTNVVFATPGTVIFGVKPIKETLTKVLHRYNIDFRTHYTPIKIDSDNKVVYFKNANPGDNTCVINEDDSTGEHIQGESIIDMPYDMLHLAPPQTAPQFVQDSDLVNANGWLDVDHHSLQHKKYPNIFGLGDVAGLPTAKTGAAIRKQAPIVVDNLLKLLAKKQADNTGYNGYSSCPLVTGYGKMVLAEFDYNNNFIPDPKLKRMLVFNSAKEHWRLYMFKKHMLPYLYWNKMMQGKEV